MRAPGLGVEEACHGALSGQRTAGEDWTCPGFRVSSVRSILHDEPTQEAEARVGVRFLTEAFKHLDQAMPETLFPIFFLSYINVNFPLGPSVLLLPAVRILQIGLKFLTWDMGIP